jgi:hypothetical protein
VLPKRHCGIRETRLQSLDKHPLRLRRRHCISSKDLQVSWVHSHLRILRQLPETPLEASRSVEWITLEAIAGGKCLVSHGLERFLHRQDAGRVARLLLRCTKLGNPVGDRSFLFFVRRDLCRSFTLLRLTSCTKIGAKSLVRFGWDEAGVSLIVPRIEDQPPYLVSK